MPSWCWLQTSVLSVSPIPTWHLKFNKLHLHPNLLQVCYIWQRCFMPLVMTGGGKMDGLDNMSLFFGTGWRGSDRVGMATNTFLSNFFNLFYKLLVTQIWLQILCFVNSKKKIKSLNINKFRRFDALNLHFGLHLTTSTHLICVLLNQPFFI